MGRSVRLGLAIDRFAEADYREAPPHIPVCLMLVAVPGAIDAAWPRVRMAVPGHTGVIGAVANVRSYRL